MRIDCWDRRIPLSVGVGWCSEKHCSICDTDPRVQCLPRRDFHGNEVGGGSFIIHGAQLRDAGTYSCWAMNELTGQKVYESTDLHVLPRFGK